MEKLLKELMQKPEVDEVTDRNIWDDEHISKGMLQAHLDVHTEGATRSYAFVQQSVEWIASLLPSSKYPQLLDLGCGPGIYAELFNMKGYQVTGIDLSKRSIDYAKQSAQTKQMNIRYDVANYITKPFDKQYNIITLIYCDFGVLSFLDRKILLKKIYVALAKGGALVFDVFTAKKYEGKEEYKTWSIEENSFWCQEKSILLEAFYCYPKEQSYLTQYTILSNDTYKRYHVWEHVFTIKELKESLYEAGFTSIDIYGNIAGQEFEYNSETICIVAKK